MRSEGSDIVADEESVSVMSETSNMADEKKQTHSGKKRSSKKINDVHDLEGRMNAKFAEQEQQYSSLNEKLSQLVNILAVERHTEPEAGVARSETVTVTDEACSAARRPILPLISADEQPNHGNLDTLSICVSDNERQNSGFMFSENASEHSEYASSIDNRSLLDLEDVKSTERFQRYLGNKPENTSTATSTTDSNQKTRCNVLGEKFGEDAYAYRSKDKTGIILEQNQIDILKGAWRSDTPQKVTCFRDSYSLPVDPSCEKYFNVPTFDNTVESLLVKRFGPKAAFGRVPCLFSKELKSLAKIAYQGQLAARMGLITSCYTQQALGILLDNLQFDTPNLDGAVQNVRDIFALSTKTFDQMSRTGSFHHMVRRRATMYDTGLSDLKDYANTVMSLPLTSEGIFGSQFDEKLKEKTERNKQLAECLPNLKRVPSSLPMKRKVTSTNETNDSGFKKGKFDNGFKIPKETGS
ncbi:unnamed protein product [Mytilus coruscus]|uniref:Uncharacterized protein n=1 Tax=Mytilus coruscus TaxID=42192 RepID=A0A6J8F386_MYTCO|nr:unnamed protein product [Mytilus coruscus]